MNSNNLLRKVAKNIINTSMCVLPGESVLISAGPDSLKFAEMLAYDAAMIGANPTIAYGSDQLSLNIYRDIDTKYLKKIPKFSRIFAKNVDVELMISDENPLISRLLPQKKLELRRRTMKPVRKIRDARVVKKTIKSVLIGFPTREKAKALGISFEKLSNIMFSTLSMDTQTQYKINERIISRLKGGLSFL